MIAVSDLVVPGLGGPLVHRYVPDFDIGHVSGWRLMAGLPFAYCTELPAKPYMFQA